MEAVLLHFVRYFSAQGKKAYDEVWKRDKKGRKLQIALLKG